MLGGSVVSSCPMGWGHGSVVEYLPWMYKFLSLTHSTGGGVGVDREIRNKGFILSVRFYF